MTKLGLFYKLTHVIIINWHSNIKIPMEILNFTIICYKFCCTFKDDYGVIDTSDI